MRNIKLTIEYDGTNYSGWQVQPNGLAIQQVIEEALERLLDSQTRLRSSGRTDAGVHAAGMVASFMTERNIPLRAFSDGLNAVLPPDISVKDAVEVPLGFNPRYDAKSKHYRYTIDNGRRRSPLSRLYAWHLRGQVNVEAMCEAGARFVGEHDFAGFRTTGCAARTTVRTIVSVEITRTGDIIHIDVVGTGFLRNMVRMMVGTIIEVGQGKRDVDSVAAVLAGDHRFSAGATAPARGLCLMAVVYPEPNFSLT